jgi:hypothetical protein
LKVLDPNSTTEMETSTRRIGSIANVVQPFVAKDNNVLHQPILVYIQLAQPTKYLRGSKGVNVVQPVVPWVKSVLLPTMLVQIKFVLRISHLLVSKTAVVRLLVLNVNVARVAHHYPAPTIKRVLHHSILVHFKHVQISTVHSCSKDLRTVMETSFSAATHTHIVNAAQHSVPWNKNALLHPTHVQIKIVLIVHNLLCQNMVWVQTTLDERPGAIVEAKHVFQDRYAMLNKTIVLILCALWIPHLWGLMSTLTAVVEVIITNLNHVFVVASALKPMEFIRVATRMEILK